MSSRAYHTSMLAISANRAMLSRYSRTTVSRMSRRAAGSMPRSRMATSKLAASRLTSHSHGPGSVSSKSFMSNTSRRSGAEKMPKLTRCASPHAWTLMPVLGVVARSDAMM